MGPLPRPCNHGSRRSLPTLQLAWRSSRRARSAFGHSPQHPQGGLALQSPLVVLECVAPAATDEHVRKCLEDFTTKSGFTIHEVTLELRDVWPSARNRWWRVLASQELGGFQIKGWRPHGAWRTVADVLECPNVGLSESLQLRLDPHELHALASVKPLSSFVLEANRPTPTALHSWGCLFRPCPCNCRTLQDRLRRGGVCGHCSGRWVCCARQRRPHTAHDRSGPGPPQTKAQAAEKAEIAGLRPSHLFRMASSKVCASCPEGGSFQLVASDAAETAPPPLRPCA